MRLESKHAGRGRCVPSQTPLREPAPVLAPGCRAHPKHLRRRQHRLPATRAARRFGLRAAGLPPGARVRLTSSIVVHGAAGATSRSVKAMLHHNHASAQHLHKRLQVASPQLHRTRALAAMSACVLSERVCPQ